MNAYWRAANYLSVGQIYLYANPLLREPLKIDHVKPRLLGHFGTTPGLNFIYAHFNRVIKKYDLDVIYMAGRVTAALEWSRTLIWKALTASSIPTSAKRRRSGKAVQTVFLSRRNSEPCRARDPGFDP